MARAHLDITNRPSYFLPRHVYLCSVTDGAVLLDLQRDKYYALDDEQRRSLSLVVQGWPDSMDLPATADQNSIEMAAELLAARLLTQDATVGKDARPLDLPVVQTRLCDRHDPERPDVHLHHIRNFVKSYAFACLNLRARSVNSAVEAVRRLKAHRLRSSTEFDTAAAVDLTKVFYWLRPIFYTAKGKCLFDSLVLTKFLACYDICALWVIGVRRFAPFTAHSWVQHGSVALNDSAEKMKAYSPILAV